MQPRSTGSPNWLWLSTGGSGTQCACVVEKGSVGLHAALLIHFKPIAAGGMISLSLPLPFVTVIELIGMQCTVWEWVFP